MIESLTRPYNERLFNTDTFRGRMHMARYIWLQEEVKNLGLNNISVLELGCYDAKAIYFLNNPSKYSGYDANWEYGLDIARETWKEKPEYTFHECNMAAEFNPAGEKFDITVCQETLEHLRNPDLLEYIKRMAMATKQYSFITVPNEQGFFFFLKYMFKKLTQGKSEEYNFKELMLTTFGMPHKVTRSLTDHKGFSYKELRGQLSEYFDIVYEKGVPFKWLPKSLSFSICILLKPKKI
ncbi:class I SAM-dependent methyltransferase [Ferruginibacter lapsinanis]|uniref:class I SAM-dependent methyltransferase n=1 Tax=Ferruginibacter lapsinanis TaxID=563172 RepID=UPI001E4B337D|nr:class I SAM-dependent methyltransferase [Ferruginibacter lapsinanis]UEG50569.1 class I SAM-dependent methyltransferase [Ferruginibacter lapsinanis]